jgi:hypothetical protein
LVGNLEFLRKKAGRRVTNLSRLFIYYNEREMEGTINDDTGAMIRDGVKSFVKLDVCTETKLALRHYQVHPETVALVLQAGGRSSGYLLSSDH